MSGRGKKSSTKNNITFESHRVHFCFYLAIFLVYTLYICTWVWPWTICTGYETPNWNIWFQIRTAIHTYDTRAIPGSVGKNVTTRPDQENHHQQGFHQKRVSKHNKRSYLKRGQQVREETLVNVYFPWKVWWFAVNGDVCESLSRRGGRLDYRPWSAAAGRAWFVLW